MTFIMRMALREIRASWQRLLFFFVCIAIGVGSIVALRSVIQSVRVALAGEARTLLGADVTLTTNRPWTDAGAADARRGAAAGRVTAAVGGGSRFRRWCGRPIRRSWRRGWWSCAPSDPSFRSTAR